MSNNNDLSIWYFGGDVVFSNLKTPDEKYKMYSVTIAVTDAVLQEFKQSGIQTTVRTDSRTGKSLISFRRPSKKLVNDVMQAVEAPGVIDSSKNSLDADLVAAGSKVVVKVLVYKTMKGIGHRLQTVMVTELQSKPTVHTHDDYAPF